MIAYAKYRSEKNKFIKNLQKQNLTKEDSLEITKLISNFSEKVSTKKINEYKSDAENVLEETIQERVDTISNDIFNSIDESYKKESFKSVYWFSGILGVLIIILCIYLCCHESIYQKGYSFLNTKEILFYIFERYSTKVFIVVGITTLIGYIIKLFSNAYSNNQDIQNSLANRLYLENSTLDDEVLKEFKEFTLLKIKNTPLKSSKNNKSFISFKNLQKMKSLLTSEEKN